jgi:hypothetical protein
VLRRPDGSVKRPATRHAARQRPHRPRFAKPFSHFVQPF